MRPTIAIVANRYSDFRRPIIEQMSAQLNDAGYGVLCVIGRELQATGVNACESMQSYNAVYAACAQFPVQGYIVLTATLSFDAPISCVTALIEKLRHKPVVSLGIDIAGVPSLVPDNRSGMRDLMLHMTADPARRNFVFIRGGKAMPDSIERESVFRDVLDERAIPIQEDLMLDGRFFSADAYAAMQSLLKRRSDIHAVVAANDVMAVSAIQALRESGLRIPGDVIVSGFDNRQVAADSVPPLTTISYSFAQRAMIAVDVLIAQLNGDDVNPLIASCRSIDSRVIIRQSSVCSPVTTNSVVSEKELEQIPGELVGRFKHHMDNGPACDPMQSDIVNALIDAMSGRESAFTLSLESYLDRTDCTKDDVIWCERIVDDCEFQIFSSNEHAVNEKLLNHLSQARQHINNARRYHDQKVRFETDRIRRLQDDFHIELASCCEMAELRSSLGEFCSALPVRRLHLVLHEKSVNDSISQAYMVLSFNAESSECYESRFQARDVLPPELQQELRDGLLVLVPLCAANRSLGYILIDPFNLPSLSVENLANSVGNAVSSCARLKALEYQALDLREKNASLSYLANNDSLTGLKNRFGFMHQVEVAIERASRVPSTLEILFIDLDGFKTVNDTCGHAAGDDVLKQVAQRLGGLLRHADYCARFGGDEFAILVEGPVGQSSADALARRFLTVLEAPFLIANMNVVLTASVGVTRWGYGAGEGSSVEELLKQADTAMYQAKASGKNRFCHYADHMAVELHKRMVIECAIQRGLEEDEFHVEYQPRINLQTGSIVGFEALMRWSPLGCDISPEDAQPGTFIPIAEAAGTIVKIDRLALEQACRQLKYWVDEHQISTRVSVNMSVIRLQQPGLVNEVRDVLAKYHIDPGMIELELTESAAMDDVALNIKTLKELRLLGVHLSIDDFGTGYSSLAYLKKLPVTCLKIDQSFLKGVTENSFNNSDAQIVKTIITLGKSMGYTLVAEGVETQEQSDFLIAHGCEQAQGYLYARALPAADATLLLAHTSYKQAEAR